MLITITDWKILDCKEFQSAKTWYHEAIFLVCPDTKHSQRVDIGPQQNKHILDSLTLTPLWVFLWHWPCFVAFWLGAITLHQGHLGPILTQFFPLPKLSYSHDISSFWPDFSEKSFWYICIICDLPILSLLAIYFLCLLSWHLIKNTVISTTIGLCITYSHLYLLSTQLNATECSRHCQSKLAVL